MAWWQLALGPKEVGLVGGITRLSVMGTPGGRHSFVAKEASGPLGPPAHVVQFRDGRRRMLIPFFVSTLEVFG